MIAGYIYTGDFAAYMLQLYIYIGYIIYTGDFTAHMLQLYIEFVHFLMIPNIVTGPDVQINFWISDRFGAK